MKLLLLAMSIVLCAALVSNAAEPIKIAPVYRPGEVLKITITNSIMTKSLTDGVPGPAFPKIKTKFDATLSFTTTDAVGINAEYACDRIEMSPENLDGTGSFDSDSDKTDSGKLHSNLSAAIGQRIKFHFRTDYHVDKVEGIEELLQKVNDIKGTRASEISFQPFSDCQRMLRGDFADAMPDKPVGVGDTWERSHSLPDPPPDAYRRSSNTSMRYRLVSVENDHGHKLANIEYTGKSDSSSEFKATAYKKTSKGEIKGTWVFDIDAGLFVKGQRETIGRHSITEDGKARLEETTGNATFVVTQVAAGDGRKP